MGSKVHCHELRNTGPAEERGGSGEAEQCPGLCVQGVRCQDLRGSILPGKLCSASHPSPRVAEAGRGGVWGCENLSQRNSKKKGEDGREKKRQEGRKRGLGVSIWGPKETDWVHEGGKMTLPIVQQKLGKRSTRHLLSAGEHPHKTRTNISPSPLGHSLLIQM